MPMRRRRFPSKRNSSANEDREIEFKAEPIAAADGGRETGYSEFPGARRGRRC